MHELELDDHVSSDEVIIQPFERLIHNKWHSFVEPNDELCLLSKFANILHHGKSDEHQEESKLTSVPGSRENERGCHRSNLHLSLGLGPVKQSEHDVVFEPVVN